MPVKRDVSPILQKIRDLLLQRKNVNFLRFRDEIAPRTQPPPNLPEGPHSRFSGNYYYTRDARRLVKPSQVLVEGDRVLQLPEGGEKPATVVSRLPGRPHNWDL